MNANEVIESYVRDVARCLPRRKRNDVAFELRALLGDELAAKAEAEGRAPDRAMAMELLRRFGRPAEAAGRYHQRPAVVDSSDTHHFLIWALAGAVAISVFWSVSPADHVSGGGLFLQWLGVLVILFGVAGWWRRRSPDALRWRPKRSPDTTPRALAALAVVGTLVFPVFMYAAPQTFVQIAFLGMLETGGLELTDAFRQSWQRAATLALLIAMAGTHVAVLVLGGRRRWTSIADISLYSVLGLLLVAHAAPMAAWPGKDTFSVFESAKENDVAMPIFGLVGAFMILCAIYELYREWTRISPAPALHDMKS